jgi:catechol 2,3-dioxygenase-like lactoylglutathione lyase family enzyme
MPAATDFHATDDIAAAFSTEQTNAKEKGMKRFHVHLGVNDLQASVRFYSDLFGASPSIQKPDYAKWMLEDPRVNFAISSRGSRGGVSHLGLQAESAEELAGIHARFIAADETKIVSEPDARCCYVHSDKHWITDPQGISWEAFHTHGPLPERDVVADAPAAQASCCDDDARSNALAVSERKRSPCCA